MRYLFLKEILKSRVLLLPLFILYILLFILNPGNSNILFVFLPLIFFCFSVIFTLMIIENYEEKNKAYSLYPQLPLKKNAILQVKYLHIIFSGFLPYCLSLILFNIFMKDTEYIKVANTFMVFSFFLAISLGSVYYLGVYTLGFTMFNKIMLIGFVGLQVLALGFIYMLRKGPLELGREEVLKYIEDIDLIRAGLYCFIIVALCYFISTLFTKKEVDR